MQTPDSPSGFRPARRARAPRTVQSAGVWDGRLAWISGLVLVLSSFMDWYVGTLPNGLTFSVTGWHTGALGKLIFFLGLVTLILEALRESGISLPESIPDRLALIVLGALATIFVLIRLISVPDVYFPSASRGIGLYVALLAALGILAAGLLRSTDDLA